MRLILSESQLKRLGFHENMVQEEVLEEVDYEQEETCIH
mgnify:CR=1 FL=1